MLIKIVCSQVLSKETIRLGKLSNINTGDCNNSEKSLPIKKSIELSNNSNNLDTNTPKVVSLKVDAPLRQIYRIPLLSGIIDINPIVKRGYLSYYSNLLHATPEQAERFLNSMRKRVY